MLLKFLDRFLKFNSSGIKLGRKRISLDISMYDAIYAVGDIHGCLSELIQCEKIILGESFSRKLIVYLGDYVDRGQNSRGVLDHFLVKDEKCEKLFLCGNHDDAFFNFIKSPSQNLAWLNVGGLETLRSYGIDAKYHLSMRFGVESLKEAIEDLIPEEHYAFLENLPVMVEANPYIFVHAGINPRVPIFQQSDYDLMWIRESFLRENHNLPFRIIHGHTPSPNPVILKERVCLDTGAYATGKLSVARIVNEEITIIT